MYILIFCLAVIFFAIVQNFSAVLGYVITAIILRRVWKWCKKHPSDEGFSD